MTVGLLIVCGVCIVIAMICAFERRVVVAVILLLLMATGIALGLFFTAPYEFGYGHVSNITENYAKRLEDGSTYQVVATSKDGDGYVLLVKKLGTSEFRALRVKEASPDIFTMIDDKPVAVSLSPQSVPTPPPIQK